MECRLVGGGGYLPLMSVAAVAEKRMKGVAALEVIVLVAEGGLS